MKEWTSSMARWEENTNNVSNDCDCRAYKYSYSVLPKSGMRRSRI